MTRTGFGAMFCIWVLEVIASWLSQPQKQMYTARALTFDLMVCCPGVSGSTVISEEFHRMVGQSLSVQCQYEPEEGPYVLKTWCRQTSPHRCTRVITTSEPRKAVRELQHTIWDDPEAGFFSINMTQLTEADSAFYWCGPFHASHRKVTVLRNISLVVSPGKAFLGDTIPFYGSSAMADPVSL